MRIKKYRNKNKSSSLPIRFTISKTTKDRITDFNASIDSEFFLFQFSKKSLKLCQISPHQTLLTDHIIYGTQIFMSHESWHLWHPLHIENSVWLYKNSMWRGRKRCQKYLVPVNKFYCWIMKTRFLRVLIRTMNTCCNNSTFINRGHNNRAWNHTILEKSPDLSDRLKWFHLWPWPIKTKQKIVATVIVLFSSVEPLLQYFCLNFEL